MDRALEAGLMFVGLTIQRSAEAWGRALVPSHSRGVPEAMGLCGAITHSRVCRGGLMRTAIAKRVSGGGSLENGKRSFVPLLADALRAYAEQIR